MRLCWTSRLRRRNASISAQMHPCEPIAQICSAKVVGLLHFPHTGEYGEFAMLRVARVSVVVSAIFLSLLGFAPAQAAGPWFVATNGSNGANCTAVNTPCLTIQG